MRDNEKFVIRKQTSAHRTGGRILLIAAMWLFVIFVVVVNLAFIFHVYSDTLVSFYLLMNLDYQLYGIVVGIIVLVSLIVWGYAAWRLRKLRGKQA
ncbi:hypothetical protein [Lactiplantibacillus mudanjiangensis]|uniref:Uncharacterized protein n=1 Tax=Lactiplantibacillus mudanjiangensis TaxID=1296538 RepID=A0A660E3J3_9LACO|nr:hypothetical protein [Lactiplantibacillus mudanjiangensis]VDG18994.1 hypothetical protein [Lactobacillus paracollinoides] [Lactiplantibacillus mudanjiangensis]VDG25233.1 hypothetical protein [Lactobacillus paracollinoides] [Lactiplantibacillus mudanjiangensis]VDG27515.1 hypothetical protein [Lactobacillus paracollinoides] [Lactiplantibacillus mudanjiangensis]VDG33090.1 hypothetical protein [Lactobacillus paracollinoides] [Lactiplantibacillus mudanjiangensis]